MYSDWAVFPEVARGTWVVCRPGKGRERRPLCDQHSVTGGRFKMRRYSCVFVVAFVLLAAGWAHAISIDGTTVVVPVVMHGHGAQSTEWRTDLWISNQTPFEKDITVTFYPNSASSSSFTTHIGSWSTIEMDDVVLSQFGPRQQQGSAGAHDGRPIRILG